MQSFNIHRFIGIKLLLFFGIYSVLHTHNCKVRIQKVQKNCGSSGIDNVRASYIA